MAFVVLESTGERLAVGKIVAAGTRYENGGSLDSALVRYNPDGSLDASFDGDGIVITDLTSGADVARDVVLQSGRDIYDCHSCLSTRLSPLGSRTDFSPSSSLATPSSGL